MIYNGFRPGESSTMTFKRSKADKGHSVVFITTRRVGDEFRLRHTAVCECGQKFSTKGGGLSALSYRHASHQRDQQ